MWNLLCPIGKAPKEIIIHANLPVKEWAVFL